MPLPKDEADALRHCAAVLAKHHSPREREIMALNLAQRISGHNNSHLCFRFKQVAALFYPNSPQRAAAFFAQMEGAHNRGELVTKVPSNEKGVFVDDLILWRDCPPVPLDSPLRYWFPVAAHERGDNQRRAEAGTDEVSIPGRLPRTSIGRLAVKIAWRIECTTKRKASAKEVMTQLQELADSGAEADILKKSAKEERAVRWLTSKYEERKYSLEACQSALQDWNKSRQTPE